MKSSSKSSTLDRLFDQDESTYWQSDGRSGEHWVEAHIAEGYFIKSVQMFFKGSDDSYCPKIIEILTS